MLLETRTIPQAQIPRSLQNRALQPRANTSTTVTSLSNSHYTVNITIGGCVATFLMVFSSDLWVAGNIPNKQSLGKSATVTYAQGSASGDVNTAAVELSGYNVSDQAFIFVADFSATGFGDPSTTEFSGLIGLGPSSSSVIHTAIGQSTGDPFLDRVFRQNTSTPNFITFLLSRAGDSAENIQGQLTIGEVVPGFENVTSQPKVPVNALPGPAKVDQHWSGLLDTIYGPDGQSIPLDSVVAGTAANKLVSIFDSGFTLPQVPRSVSDAIYGRVQGAEFDTQNGVWGIPCDQEVNLTIAIGGQNYTVHPLDTSSSDLNYTTPSGKPACVGTFQPISTALDGTFDAVMGMAFLRNTYTSINFGDFVDGNPENQGDPFLQLLSITNAAQAHKDFVTTRLNGVDTTGDSAHALLPPSQAQHSPESNTEKAKNIFFRNWPYILAGVGGVLLLAVGFCLYRCCCRRRAARGRGGLVAGPYRPLHDPAPAPAMDLHAMGPPQGAYSDPYYRG
ncbi:acid protease [Ramaria rubella]|nr:acid protease [Ramaria rubella]